MATSGSIDFSMTAGNLVTFALKKTNIIHTMSEATAEQMRDGIQDLTLMLKSWQMTGPHLWRQTEGSVALVASTASYTLSPRPYRVLEARYRDANGRDMPMLEVTRDEYMALPVKTSTGVPTQFYVDYQRTSAVMYVWPVPASVTTETLQHTYQRVIEDIDSKDDEIDIPQEWFETVGYALADRVPGVNDPKITARAAQLMALAYGADVEPYVQFVPGR